MTLAEKKIARSAQGQWNYCRDCGNGVRDIDVGFSPSVQRMRCECGGLFRRPSLRDALILESASTAEEMES